MVSCLAAKFTILLFEEDNISFLVIFSGTSKTSISWFLCNHNLGTNRIYLSGFLLRKRQFHITLTLLFIDDLDFLALDTKLHIWMLRVFAWLVILEALFVHYTQNLTWLGSFLHFWNWICKNRNIFNEFTGFDYL